MEQLGPDRTDFHEIWNFGIFRKSVEKIRVSLQSDNINTTLHEDQYTVLIIYRSVLLTIRNISDEARRQNQNTFNAQELFSWMACLLWNNVAKYCRTGQAIDDNMAHVHWLLTKATNILAICNTHCFSLEKWLHELAWMLDCSTSRFFFVMNVMWCSVTG